MKHLTFYRCFATALVIGFMACKPVLAAGDPPYVNRYNDPSFGTNNVLQGTAYETMRQALWLDRIAAVPKGRNTLRSGQGSGHQLVSSMPSMPLFPPGAPGRRC